MLIFVSSPLKGFPPYSEIKMVKNLEDAAWDTREVLREGHTPVTPHLMLERVLDDDNEAERAMGIRAGLDLLSHCDQLWVFAQNGISAGMREEIQFAQENHIPVVYK